MSRSQAIEPAAAASSKAFTATLAGAGTTTLGGYTGSDLAMIGGFAVAVAGLLVQWYYRREENRLKRRAAELLEAEHQMRMREHEARMAELRE
ncbi:MAG: HP1 family phage holin [Inhella sp.]